MNRFTLFIFSLILLSAPPVSADKFFVGPDETYKTIGAVMFDVSEGDTIIVRDGIYDKTVDVRMSLTLMAEHRHKAILGDGSGPEGVLRVKRGTVIIDGFKFNGVDEYAGIIVSGDSANAAIHCVIRNNLILNRNPGILVAGDAYHCIIDSNTIIGSVEHGIVPRGKGLNTISNNRIENSNGSGILVSEISGDSVKITGNQISGNGRYGVEIRRSHVTMTGNIIRDNTEYGIIVGGGLNHIMIKDSNQVDSNAMNGIVIESQSSASIHHNLIRDNQDRGILVMVNGTADITGNIIMKSGSYGILNEGSANITGNTITGNKTNGIENRPGAAYTWIGNNQIKDNAENGVFLMEKADLYGNTISGNGFMGIFIEGPPGTVQVKGNNHILSNVQHGIFISLNSTAEVMNNTIAQNGTGVVDMEDFSGIFINGSARVEGNIIENNHGSGITVDQNASNTVILNNTAINGNREGIMMNGTAAVENNSIDSNLLQGIYIGPAGNISLKNNRLSGNTTGIFIHPDASNISLYNCDMTGNERGIVSRGEVKIRRSTIENNTTVGVRIMEPGIDLGQDSEGEGGFNTIRNNGNWNLRNSTPDTVYACYNYWGMVDSLEIDASISDDDEDTLMGPVIFTPFLSQDITGIAYPSPLLPADREWGLQKVYPNPFREVANISYRLTEPSRVTIKVTDLRGAVVSTPISGQYHESGLFTVQWDGRTDGGRVLGSGTYILMIMSEDKISAKLIQVLR